MLVLQDEEQAGQADRDTHAGQLLVRIVLGQVVIAATRADGTDLWMVEHGSLIDRARIVVQPAGNGQVNGKMVGRHAEILQIGRDRGQLGNALVQGLILALIALECFQDALGAALDGDKAQDLVGLRGGRAAILGQDLAHLVRPNLLQLVDRTHDITGLVRQAQHGKKAV